MTTPHRTLQMALDALDAITDDVDGTGLNTMPSFDKALDAITALREALAADHLRDVAEKVAPAAPVPDGMVMVPREPTEDMIQAAAGAWGESEGGLHNAFAAALRGGIAASPAAPVVPLTDEQINEIASALFYVDEPAGSTVMRFRLQWLESIARPLARAIEAAHGITGGKP